MVSKEQQLADAMDAYEEGVQDMLTNIDEIRKRAKIMRSSTFKAIAELEDVPPERWEDGLLEEVIEDVVAIDRVRWFERAVWIFVVLSVGTGAFIAGWFIKPIPEHGRVEWDCTVVVGSTEEVECTGVQ